MDQDQWNYLNGRRFQLRLRVRMNRMYQQQRQRTMELREGAVKAASLVAGSVALANVTSADTIRYCAAVIFTGTAGSLVFGWGGKARDAGRRAAEWSLLERDIEAAGERTFTEAQLDQWFARANEIESSEPAANPHMMEHCYREACHTLNAKPTPSTSWWRGRLPALIIP